jgi:hypothetical protein
MTAAGSARITLISRSHILLHCQNEKLLHAGKKTLVLLANPRWEHRLVRLLELAGLQEAGSPPGRVDRMGN